jgi:Rrf2 family protein
MLTKTSQLAIRSLLWIAQQEPGAVLPPRRIAEALRESPSYMAKVARALVRAGLLRAERGVKGGVRLERAAESISLLEVVEACQGTLLGNYCRGDFDAGLECSYHVAAYELHMAITGVLSKWTMARLLAQPGPAGTAGQIPCLMALAGNGRQDE